KEFDYGIKNRYMRTTVVNTSTLHPIYLNKVKERFAIRSTNLDNSQNASDGWYAVTGGAPDATSTTPQYVWLLVPHNTTGIEVVEPFVMSTNRKIFDLQGRPSMARKKGIYISDGRKIVVK
ncbi:MAG: hypothetical protein IKI18_04455, partial [Prevotella sp.]|nr:hypothetical protein [Prevotella sp.]